MATRAIWRAAVVFGDVEVPVKLYAGVQDTTVHFRLLHDKDLAPVKQMMVEPDNGKPVVSEDVQRGALVGPGRFVVLTADEVASVEPKESRQITIDRFIPAAALDHAFYDRPYWLGPDGPRDEHYWALVAALKEEKREGIARWVMRKRPYIGALRVRDDRLVLITTRHADEVVSPAEVKVPAGRAPERNELAMARQLVAAMEAPFDPSEYHDEYRQRVLELLQRKAKGEKIAKVHAAPRRQAPSLEDALRRSIAAVGAPSKRPAAVRHAASRKRKRTHG